MTKKLTSAQVCKELGINERTLRDWCNNHGCPRHGKTHKYRYDPDEIRQWMDEQRRTGHRGRVAGELQGPGGVSLEVEDVRQELLHAKLRKELAVAAKHELDVQKKRGEVLDAAEVERQNLDKIARVKAVLLGGPATLAVDLEGLDVEGRENAIRTWVESALKELASE